MSFEADKSEILDPIVTTIAVPSTKILISVSHQILLLYLQNLSHVFVQSLKNTHSACIQDTTYKTLQTSVGPIKDRMPYSPEEKPASEYLKQKNQKLHETWYFHIDMTFLKQAGRAGADAGQK